MVVPVVTEEAANKLNEDGDALLQQKLGVEQLAGVSVAKKFRHYLQPANPASGVLPPDPYKSSTSPFLSPASRKRKRQDPPRPFLCVACRQIITVRFGDYLDNCCKMCGAYGSLVICAAEPIVNTQQGEWLSSDESMNSNIHNNLHRNPTSWN